MFEKEAEEIANEKLCSEKMCYNHCNFSSPKHHRCGEWHRCYGSAKDGIEFGYNNANEWHFVKDGDLPKENQLVLLYRENLNGANVALTHWYKSYVNDKVIAWKEIILPKESE